MTKKVSWGILSAGKIAKEWVCPGIHNSPHGIVAAVASRTPGKAEALAEPFDAWTYDNYEDLLSDANIQAVYIPLPNDGHVEWTIKALEAGKHVLCEKPIALKADEIDAIIKARDDSGCFAAEAFMVTHHPQWLRVRELIAAGEIGELVHVQGAFSYFNDDATNIRNRADVGGGVLRDIGVYPTVVTRFVTGAEPESIRSKIDWDLGVDATVRVWADFPSFSTDFYVSMRMAGRQEMVFHGTKGWIKVHAPFNAIGYGDEMVEVRGADGVSRFERFAGKDQYMLQAEAFNQAVLNDGPFECSLEFSKGNQRMVDMIYAGEE